jgi:hypothetical protein
MFGPSRGHAPTRNTSRKRSPKRSPGPESTTQMLRSAACDPDRWQEFCRHYTQQNFKNTLRSSRGFAAQRNRITLVYAARDELVMMPSSPDMF